MSCSQYYKFFETIAHKSRWRILEALASKPLTVTEICAELKEEQSAVSHNLRKLAECRIITAEQIGKRRRYSLNKETFAPLLKLVGKHVEKYCRCGCGRKRGAVDKNVG